MCVTHVFILMKSTNPNAKLITAILLKRDVKINHLVLLITLGLWERDLK